MKENDNVFGTVEFKDLDSDKTIVKFDATKSNLLNDKQISHNKVLETVRKFIDLRVTREDLIEYYKELNLPLSEEEIQSSLLIESEISSRLHLLLRTLEKL